MSKQIRKVLSCMSLQIQTSSSKIFAIHFRQPGMIIYLFSFSFFLFLCIYTQVKRRDWRTNQKLVRHKKPRYKVELWHQYSPSVHAP